MKLISVLKKLIKFFKSEIRVFGKDLNDDFWVLIFLRIWIDNVLKSLDRERQIKRTRFGDRKLNRDFGQNLVIFDQNFKKSTKNDLIKNFSGSNPCPILSFSPPNRTLMISVCMHERFEHSSRNMIEITKFIQMAPEIDETFSKKVQKHSILK